MRGRSSRPTSKAPDTASTSFAIRRWRAGCPTRRQLKENFTFVSSQIEAGKILSAWSVGFGGVGEGLAKMAFGNGIGAEVTMDEAKLYEYAYGSILVECEGTLEYPHAELLASPSPTRR